MRKIKVVVLLIQQLQHGFTKNAKVSPNFTVAHIPVRTYLITLCSYYNNPVNVGITYIPSADWYYRLEEFYSLSTVN